MEVEESKRYVAVIHKFFVHSEGWEVINLEAKTRKDADSEADSIYRWKNAPFTKADVLVLEIAANEKVKLSLMQRLFGFGRT